MGILDGRVIIVTGAGRGLGREHCLELARQGASLVVNDLGVGLHGQRTGKGESPAADVVAEVVAAGGRAVADGASVADFAAVGEMIEGTISTFGRLDAVVNNAGIVRDRMITGMSEEEFDQVVGVHLKGTWDVTRHACSYWRDQAKAGFDPFDPANASPVVAFLCSVPSGWLSGSVLRIQGDTVQVLRPWSIDPAHRFCARSGERLPADQLDRGLRMALGALPSGIPAGSVIS